MNKKTETLTQSALEFVDYITLDGILFDEKDEISQLIRDRFPQGVDTATALEATRLRSKGDLYLEASSLHLLAMVPVFGIEQRIWHLYSFVKESKNESDYLTKYLLVEALCYLDEPEGWKEFAKLKEEHLRTTKLPEHLAARWFKTSEKEIAQWKSDRAAGKRWEREE